MVSPEVCPVVGPVALAGERERSRSEAGAKLISWLGDIWVILDLERNLFHSLDICDLDCGLYVGTEGQPQESFVR
jgi:hypothetical protein